MRKKKRIYFETSSVNYINDNVARIEIPKLRKRFLNEEKWTPVLSPLTLYEIICSSDDERKDDLIMTCQLFFGKDILPSLCEIVDAYVAKGMPVLEYKVRGRKRNHQMAAVWENICDNRNMTIVRDKQEISKYKSMLDRHAKILYDAINNSFSATREEDDYDSIVIVTNEIYDLLLSTITEHNDVDSEMEIYFKANIFFILLILLFLEGPINSTESFWKRRHKKSMKEKVEYIVSNLSGLLFRGPTVIMANMALMLARGKFSRGSLLDCLHAGYIPYVSAFVSNDNHFADFDCFVSRNYICRIVRLNRRTENQRCENQ